MKPSDRMLLQRNLRDQQVVDSDGRRCGMVDGVELDGAPGGELRVAALLVGPGAFEARLPPLLYAVVRAIAGDRVVRVPWRDVGKVNSAVRLTKPASALGLARAEERARRWVGRIPGS